MTERQVIEGAGKRRIKRREVKSIAMACREPSLHENRLLSFNAKLFRHPFLPFILFVHTLVSYLKYGPFSSFSPSYDSSNATITKEDSDLLYSAYGDSNGTYYAQR